MMRYFRLLISFTICAWTQVRLQETLLKHPNGKTKSIQTWYTSLPNEVNIYQGQQLEYHSNGQLKSKVFHDMGRLDGRYYKKNHHHGSYQAKQYNDNIVIRAQFDQGIQNDECKKECE